MSAFLSHKYKLIFPHVPRTGGTSLSELINPHLGGSDITDGQFEKHQSLRLIKIGHPKEFASYIKFAMVRHPFDRLASLVQGYKPTSTVSQIVDQLVSGRINFKTYAFFWPMQKWLCDTNGDVLVDVIFRLERGLDKAVEFLIKAGMPIKLEDIPHINRGPEASKRADYYEDQRRQCNGRTMDAIKKLYEWDFKTFGYE